MQFFAKNILLDQHGRATNFRLQSLEYPHMRALHLVKGTNSLKTVIKRLAGLALLHGGFLGMVFDTTDYAAHSCRPQDICHRCEQFQCSFCLGHDLGAHCGWSFCERFGPRRVMAGLLVFGAIPCAMTGLLKNASGLFGLRFVIGILGATFIPSQFWTTQMFAPSVVGTANAFTGGWGNMGGGVTYLLMPAIHDGLRRHLPESQAWRVVFVIPAGICILLAICVLLFATDTPQGDWFKRQTQTLVNPVSITAEKDITVVKDEVYDLQDDDSNDETIEEVNRDEPPSVALANWFRVLIKPPVLIMACTYACSFGVELAIDNIIGQVYQVKFKLDASKAAYIGSIFGLLNICSRLSGGLFSDFMAHRLHMPGRILALLSTMVLQGVYLIGFSFGLVSLSTSIVLMVFFSFFVQHVCGSTFAIVPFIDPVNNGKVMGIVGASGTLGGLIFNLMFRALGTQYERAFLCLGCISLGVAIIGCLLLRVQKKTIWHLYHRRNA